MMKKGTVDIWERIWSESTVEAQLADLPRDEYFEHINDIAKKFPKGSLILEAGCGLARWVFHLNGLGYETVGLDIESAGLRNVLTFGKYIGESLILIRGDVFNLPFKDGVFDLILSLGVVEHFEKGKERLPFESPLKL